MVPRYSFFVLNAFSNEPSSYFGLINEMYEGKIKKNTTYYQITFFFIFSFIIYETMKAINEKHKNK